MRRNIFYLFFTICFSANAQWYPQTAGISTSHQISGMDFIHPDTGIIVIGSAGIGGLIRKTIDGGTTWTTSTSPLSSSINYNGVKMIDKNISYIAGFDYYNTSSGGVILKTINGASSWTIQSEDVFPGLMAIDFINKDTGFAVGYNGIIIKTINGGTTWTSIASGLTSHLRDVSFPTRDTGYVVSLSGEVLKSTDMGSTWSFATSTTSGNFRCNFTSFNTGFTCAGNTINKTMDGGSSWSNTILSGSNFQGIHFPTADTGYVVGGFGNICRTIDGGLNWQTQVVGTFGLYGFYSVYFPTSLIGYAGGHNGKLFKTRNGGGTINVGTETINNEQNIVVSPNPSNGIFKILHFEPISEIEIINLFGEKVFHSTYHNELSINIDLSFLGKGYYHLNITENNSTKNIFKPIIIY